MLNMKDLILNDDMDALHDIAKKLGRAKAISDRKLTDFHESIADLMQAIGLPETMVRTLDIHIGPADLVTVKAEILVPEEVGNKLASMFKTFKLVPYDDSPPSGGQ